MRRALIAALLVSSWFPASAQDLRRDGNWWSAQSRGDQITYLIGFVDGLSAGYDAARSAVGMSAFMLPKCDEKTCGQLVAMNRQDDSEIEKNENRIDEITVGQLLEGLNKIYSDYRNRTILVPTAEVVVVESIHGSTDDRIEKRLEYFRQHAE